MRTATFGQIQKKKIDEVVIKQVSAKDSTRIAS